MIIWIHMNLYDVYYLTFPRHPESLDLTFWAFDAFVPVDDFEDLKAGKGPPGGKTCCTDWHQKKYQHPVFKKLPYITYVLHYFFAGSI